MRRFLLGITVYILYLTSLNAQDVKAGEKYYKLKDYANALKVWASLAEQGNPDAQYKLAWMYDFGTGVSENNTEAIKWYRLAAEQGHVSAQYNLGIIYDTGEGVSQNKITAVKWYKLAAKQGHALAQNNLGVMYENGEGVAQDRVLAYQWYEIAATNGSAPSENWRDQTAKEMTLEEISKAQQMSRACMKSNYQDCGH